MGQLDETVLSRSPESRELKRTAIAFASDKDPKSHDILKRYLDNTDFLERLDSLESYQFTSTRLRLARVIKTLMDNRLPSTDKVLVDLIKATGYQGHVLRMQLLVKALAVVKPSPPDAVAYWDKMSQPESPLAYDVVEATCINQSPPALTLLETKIADQQHARDTKVVWMRQLILPRRNDVPLLNSCEKMVLGPMPLEVKHDLVEALFDYKKDQWYRGCSPPQPPPLASATETSKNTFRRIGTHALRNLKLVKERKDVVKARLEELDAPDA